MILAKKAHRGLGFYYSICTALTVCSAAPQTAHCGETLRPIFEPRISGWLAGVYFIPRGDWLARVLIYPGSVYPRVNYTLGRLTRQGIKVYPRQCVPRSILYPGEIDLPAYYGISWAVCTYDYIIPQGDLLARVLQYVPGSEYIIPQGDWLTRV